jgi:hypothetical protein
MVRIRMMINHSRMLDMMITQTIFGAYGHRSLNKSIKMAVCNRMSFTWFR